MNGGRVVGFLGVAEENDLSRLAKGGQRFAQE